MLVFICCIRASFVCDLSGTREREHVVSRSVPSRRGCTAAAQPHVANFYLRWGDTSDLSRSTAATTSMSQVSCPGVELSPVAPAESDICVKSCMLLPLCYSGITSLWFVFSTPAGQLVRNGRIVVTSALNGLLRELSPGHLAPETRIMPLDQAAII